MLDSQVNDEGQLRGGMTAYAMARIADSPCIDAIEISYTKVWAMIDIPTERRTHGKNPTDEKIMLNLPRDHIRDITYADCRPLNAKCRVSSADIAYEPIGKKL